MVSGRVHKIAELPKAKRDKAVQDIVLGRKSMGQVGKELGISDAAVGRYMRTVTEEERLSILANAAHDAKVRAAMQNAEVVNELGEDVQHDVKWLLRELKTLLTDAKGDDDRVLQLGTLKELRQSLLALADLQGKLSRKVEVHFALHESPAFLELRRVMIEVLDKHPEAKADFLERMGKLKVVEPKALPR
jgi:transposase-like protein